MKSMALLSLICSVRSQVTHKFNLMSQDHKAWLPWSGTVIVHKIFPKPNVGAPQKGRDLCLVQEMWSIKPNKPQSSYRKRKTFESKDLLCLEIKCGIRFPETTDPTHQRSDLDEKENVKSRVLPDPCPRISFEAIRLKSNPNPHPAVQDESKFSEINQIRADHWKNMSKLTSQSTTLAVIILEFFRFVSRGADLSARSGLSRGFAQISEFGVEGIRESVKCTSLPTASTQQEINQAENLSFLPIVS